MNKIIKEFDWEEELSVLAEKYCNHNDIDEFNNCLYYIFRPLILKALKEQKKEIREELERFDRDMEIRLHTKPYEIVKSALKDILKDKMSIRK